MNSNPIKGHLAGNDNSYNFNNYNTGIIYSPQAGRRRTETFAPRIGHLPIDLERDTIDDALASVHVGFINFLQKHTLIIAKAYRIEYGESNELKYAISPTFHNANNVVCLSHFIDEFNKSRHSKYVNLSIEIVHYDWEGPAFTREIYW